MHYKTLTDSVVGGKVWSFLRWGVYAGAVTVCVLYVVPLTAGAIAAGASYALSGTTAGAIGSASLPWIGTYIPGLATTTTPITLGASTAAFQVAGPILKRVGNVPRHVNEIGVHLHNWKRIGK
jgi:hypothetical protein